MYLNLFIFQIILFLIILLKTKFILTLNYCLLFITKIKNILLIYCKNNISKILKTNLQYIKNIQRY